MTEHNFKIKKVLRWIKVSDLVINPEYRIYQPRERADLKSIKTDEVIEPFTGLFENDAVTLINGFDRYDAIMRMGMPDMIVPVWVITDTLTPDQVNKLILDLSRQKQKTHHDYVIEYKLYDSIIPTHQGVKQEGPTRHKVIAGLMGISTSQLSKLLMINEVKPTLLQEVDHGHRTLAGAEQKAKEIKRQLPEAKEKKESRQLDLGKHVDIAGADTVCPTCKRPFGEMDWKDLPGFFTFKRDETNNQTTWLEPLDDSINPQAPTPDEQD
jgi:hypothetical protein